MTLAVAAAAAQGDRSENAEYTYGKKRLHEIDRRVRFLRKRLEGMTIVDADGAGARATASRVYFGAWVQVGYADGERRWHRIVGPDEFDMAPEYISMDSPLGRSLLRRALDEEVTSSCRRARAPDWRSRSRSAAAALRPSHSPADVLELPGIGGVQILGEQFAALVQRRPVGVLSDDRAQVGHADLERPPKSMSSGSTTPRSRIFHRPDHAGERRDGDLQAGGAVVGRELARLVDRQLRAVPVGVFLVPASSTPSSSMPPVISSHMMRLRSCSCQLRPANSCTDRTAASLG